MRKILSICILTFGMCLKGQEAQKLNINDPRNPDCPCHKYQKLADEEYKKLLVSAGKKKPEKKKEIEDGTSLSENERSSAEQKINEEGISLSEKEISKNHQYALYKMGNNSLGNANNGGNIDRGNISAGTSQKKSISQNYIRHRKKRHMKKHPLLNRIKEWEGWDVCKESRVVSACFHWK